MKIRVMGTIPKDTYTIFIQEYQLPVTLEEFTEEAFASLLSNMQIAELMPGNLLSPQFFLLAYYYEPFISSFSISEKIVH